MAAVPLHERISLASVAAPREVLSPELVLVSPELRQAALAELPDRPWEAFLPAQLPAEPTVVKSAEQAPAKVVLLPPVAELPSPSRRGRYAALLAVGLMAGFVTAQLAQLRRGNTAPVSTSARPPSPPATTAPARPADAGVAVARGGYVFGRSGRFLVSSDLRTVRGFQAQVRCAGRISIATIRLKRTRFGYSDQVRVRKRALQIEVAGRFLDRSTARGYVRASSRRCDSGKVPFVAKLS